MCRLHTEGGANFVKGRGILREGLLHGKSNAASDDLIKRSSAKGGTLFAYI